MIEKTVTTYVANDGSVFTNKQDCLDYEANCARNIFTDCPLLLKNMEHIAPKIITHKPTPYHTKTNQIVQYEWLLIQNKDDFKNIQAILLKNNKTSAIIHSLKEPTAYPTILALEKTMPDTMMALSKYRYTGAYTYVHEEILRFDKYTKFLFEKTGIKFCTNNT